MKVRVICHTHNDATVVPLDGRAPYDWLVYSQTTLPELAREDYHNELDPDDLLCTGGEGEHEFWLQIADFNGFTVPKHGTMQIRI